MNYQETSIELEKLVKLFKALEHTESIISSLASADTYKSELTNKVETLKTEVATLEAKKSQSEVDLSTLVNTKTVEANYILAVAKEEAEQTKNKAKEYAAVKLARADKDAEIIVAKAYTEVGSLEGQIKALQVQKAATQEELKDLESKLQSVKTQITKLLGN
jgi:peptidoglycan hydrolase CwlO-like protein